MGEIVLIGPELAHEAMEKVLLIRVRLKMDQSRKKSYDDVRNKDLEFDVYDWVCLKLSPMKGSIMFGKKKKLISHFVVHIKF